MIKYKKCNMYNNKLENHLTSSEKKFLNLRNDLTVLCRWVVLLLDVRRRRLLDCEGIELGDLQITFVADLRTRVHLAIVPTGVLQGHVFDLQLKQFVKCNDDATDLGRSLIQFGNRPKQWIRLFSANTCNITCMEKLRVEKN